MSELAVGKVIRMPCMRKGLCAYHDETVYLTQEVLEQLAQTGHGIPVTIEHPEDAITGENVGQLSVGRVSKMEYSLEDDLWYAEFVVETEEAAKLLRDGWGVSTAWYGEEYGSGGTLNNVPYDREVKRARYEHLAVVKTPRYEMAIGARFLNSKTGQVDSKDSTMDTKPTPNTRGTYMLGRVWKMITTREEIKTNANEDLHVEVDGEAKPLKNILEDMKAMKDKKAEGAAEPEKKMLCGEDEVEVDGKKMSVNELIKAYKDACGSSAKAEGAVDEKHEQGPLEIEVKHEEEPMAAGKDEAEEKKAEGAADEDDKKEASAEEEDEKKKKEAEGEDKGDEKKKTNARFAKIKELHENGVIEPEIESSFTSTRERVDLGRARYGTK